MKKNATVADKIDDIAGEAFESADGAVVIVEELNMPQNLSMIKSKWGYQ